MSKVTLNFSKSFNDCKNMNFSNKSHSLQFNEDPKQYVGNKFEGEQFLRILKCQGSLIAFFQKIEKNALFEK